MRLRSLRLQGFKSFADRTEIEFREGVTAIVGSNGCGKSNIGDAIRWVLGEQRASAVRGGKMDEMIFAGTTRRRPLNLAEVSLRFSNEQGRLSVPQSEIDVTRKVFRDGASEYLLNRVSCRLRDIRGLLRDTGSGANAVSIIEAGMVEALLGDRGDERRALFEEAAGIGKYKDSREAATRRLEAAEGDLLRLDDRITEVQAKARALDRQRRKAERHRELTDRRRTLEIAIARAELAALDAELAQQAQQRDQLERALGTIEAELRELESRISNGRRHAGVLGARRSQAGRQLDAIREALHTTEREHLLAEERRKHIELRLSQLARDRQDSERRAHSSAAEAERLAAQVEQLRATWKGSAARQREWQSRGEELRAELAVHRHTEEVAVRRSREIARELTTAEGEYTAAERRRGELDGRVQQLVVQKKDTSSEVQRFGTLAVQLENERAMARDRVQDAERRRQMVGEEIEMLRRRAADVQTALHALEKRCAEIAAEVSAREAVEGSYQGFSPAVGGLMEARGRIGGVHAPLADFLARETLETDRVRAVEGFLGPLLQAVVVEDLESVRRIRRWFDEEWKGGGSLWLLPRDAPLLDGVCRTDTEGTGSGAGADWAHALLAHFRVHPDPFQSYTAGEAQATPEGDVREATGIVRLGERRANEGILARRHQLAALREESEKLDRQRGAVRENRAEIQNELRAAESRQGAIEAERGRLAVEAQRLDAEHAGCLHRLHREGEELARIAGELERLRSASSGDAERLETLAQRLATLQGQASDAEQEADAASSRSANTEQRWEELRNQDVEVRVEVARAEAACRDAERRLQSARDAAAAASTRIRTADAEARELHRTLDELGALISRAQEQLRELGRARDGQQAETEILDRELAETEHELERTEHQATELRRRAAETAAARHRLELHTADARSRTERIREKLEAEWRESWTALVDKVAAELPGSVGEWKDEGQRIAAQLQSLGAVNPLAVEEHADEERRLAFLIEQRDDLRAAREDIAAAIRQIDRTAREVFLSTFHSVRENFHRVFHSLFEGGECDLWLADAESPLESAVEIQASPKGKRTQRIHLLSGGERTLTALALLFAIYLVKPSPFCVFDEVDAPLDEANIGRFIQLLQDFKEETQFIVITHHPRTMAAADWVYGVTMEEPGVSSIVGVELEGVWPREEQVA